MAKYPDDRYPSAGDLGRAALAAAAGRRPPSASGSSPSAPPRRSSRRRSRRPPGGARQDDPTFAEAETRSCTPRTRGARALLARTGSPPRAAGIAVARRAELGTTPRRRELGRRHPDRDGHRHGGAVGAGAVDADPVGDRPNVVGATAATSSSAPSASTRLSSSPPRPARCAPTRRGRLGVSDSAATAAVWVAVARATQVVQLDAKTGRRASRSRCRRAAARSPSPRRRLGRPDHPATGSPTSSPRSTRGRARRRDPRARRDLALAAGPTALWVASRRRARCQCVDPDGGPARARRPRRQQPPEDIAYGGGALWVATPGTTPSTRYRPRTQRPIAIGVGQQPAPARGRRQRVYVANYNSSDLYDDRREGPTGSASRSACRSTRSRSHRRRRRVWVDQPADNQLPGRYRSRRVITPVRIACSARLARF